VTYAFKLLQAVLSEYWVKGFASKKWNEQAFTMALTWASTYPSEIAINLPCCEIQLQLSQTHKPFALTFCVSRSVSVPQPTGTTPHVQSGLPGGAPFSGMLQSLNPLQDENSQPYGAGIRQALDTGKRFAGNASNTPLGKPAGLSSARKALGNITNRSTIQHDNATPFKATPAVLGPRKKLGDITNATPAKPGQLAKTLLEKSRSQAKPKSAKQRSKAEIYAEDGIEILAGRSGQQLEAERQLRDLTDAKTNAAYFASLPAFQPPAMKWSRVSQRIRVEN